MNGFIDVSLSGDEIVALMEAILTERRRLENETQTDATRERQELLEKLWLDFSGLA